MQFDELIKLVQEVGKAGLTDFEFREGEIFIKMSAATGEYNKKNQRDLPSVPDSYRNSLKKRREESGRESAPAAKGDYVVETNIPIHREEPEADRKREVIEAPAEGVFTFSRIDGTPCPLKIGDHLAFGQVVGTLKSRGKIFEIQSLFEGEVTAIYIEDEEELVAREPMVMVAL